ncbi:MAG: hypothetical protein AAGJ46_11360 [Planctomycetota bacterium]
MTDTNYREQADRDDWAPCSPGDLGRLASRLRQADERQRGLATVKTAAGVAGGVAVLVLAIGLLQGPAAAPAVDACAACKAEFAALNEHLTGGPEMPADRYEPTWDHLANCEKCRKAFERRHPGLLERAGMAIAARLGWLLPVATH